MLAPHPICQLQELVGRGVLLTKTDLQFVNKAKFVSNVDPVLVGPLGRARREKRSFLDAALFDQDVSAQSADTIAFVPRFLASISFPHSEPNGRMWTVQSGHLRVSLLDGDMKLGLPFGAKLRLMLACACQEAVRTKKRDVVLGKSTAEAMKRMGLRSTGGKTGSVAPFLDQFSRLFSSAISIHWSHQKSPEVLIMNIADQFSIGNHRGGAGRKVSVVLSEAFFNYLIKHPVPLDMRTMIALKDSALAMDIYMWASYKMSHIQHNRPLTVSWSALQLQFGSNYCGDSRGATNFRSQFKKQLTWVSIRYPEARIEVHSAGLTLRASPTDVQRSYTHQPVNSVKSSHISGITPNA